MHEAELIVDVLHHVADPEVVPAILGQLGRVRARVPVARGAVRVKDYAWVDMPLDHCNERLVVLRRAVVDYGYARVEVDQAPGPLEVRECAHVAPPLSADQRLVDGHAARDPEVRFDPVLDVVAQGAANHPKVVQTADSRQSLAQELRRAFDPQNDGLIELDRVDCIQRRAVVDGNFPLAEWARPEIVVRELIQTMPEDHFAVAHVAPALVMQQASCHPVVEHFDFRSQVHKLVHFANADAQSYYVYFASLYCQPSWPLI